MTPDFNKPMSAHDAIQLVKAMWDNAPAGPKKDASFLHYQAAEIAARTMNDTQTYRQLEAASQALR
ncbi:MAG: hypothetical protein K9G33_04075 [Sneathiella sp.]|nr:hypothetical protein [Sneathiella sp.]